MNIRNVVFDAGGVLLEWDPPKVIARLFPGKLDLKRTATLYGSSDQLARALTGEDPAQLAAQWAADEVKWYNLRSKYLIYR